MTVAIQGFPGAYHEIAVRQYFGDVDIHPTETFDELVAKVEKNEVVDAGMMALENSISGSLLPNYNLINHSTVQIVGEVYLRIEQNLMALPGTRIEDLKEVHSHPVALAQCKEFFVRYPDIKLVASIDTALSAQTIRDEELTHVGALASDLAAELYGLEILAEGIETNKRNFTRFVAIDHFMDVPDDNDFNKISVSFAVSHEVGSLYKALKVLSENGANMTKIQSAPIQGRPFEYLFYVDFMLKDNNMFGLVFHELTIRSKGLKILGKYKASQT